MLTKIMQGDDFHADRIQFPGIQEADIIKHEENQKPPDQKPFPLRDLPLTGQVKQ